VLVRLGAYRFCQCARAEGGDAFRGEGARIVGGRWNPPGVAVVYASSSLSLADLELLAHFESSSQAPDLLSFTLRFCEELVSVPESLPPDWRRTPPAPSARQAGTDWFKSGRSAILRVPSVIIPSEFNFLLNPACPDFKLIEIGPPEPFTIDPRLLGSI